jgi:hypothetical protein
VLGRCIEEDVTGERLGGSYGVEETDELRDAFAIIELGVAVSVIIFDGEIGEEQFARAGGADAHANEKEAVLGDTGGGAFADLREPAGFQDRVDETSELDTVTHGVGARPGTGEGGAACEGEGDGKSEERTQGTISPQGRFCHREKD